MQGNEIVTTQRVRTVRVRSRNAQRGASLLEAIAYLGIAAIVVIGAVALLNGAFNSAGTNELSEQVNAIQAGVKKLYMGQAGGYTNVNNSVLSAAGVFPSTVPVASGGAATDVWGGNVTVGAGTSPGTFTIEYDNVPPAVCINAVTAGGSWSSITVGTATETLLPIDPSTAQKDCGTSNVSITWTST
ncbi:type 4 pilus major pilin [Paraburkholderia sp. SARCC-3016]|uniref:type 4 pilus major pilin n=1 Tax=Paraburkholderia sp. SARCC-3016 TaxID=3058611 RepID=UPI002806A061|nr:type 4 pilus major pilin [Paraburkholderia sp. SARCC-3016]MDQ7980284.1 type 4 pilus major pilin [Paraburkholderia sp. SARCC-3016]